MVRRILIALMAVVLAGFLWWGYAGYREGHDLGNGDVAADTADRPRKLPSISATSSPTPSTTASPVPAQNASEPAVYPPAQTSAAPETMTAMPESDTIGPNPPNGMIFAGTGHYQIYRQGNLTWRVNTDNGRACILFATDEEWRKSKVYRHGCGNR